MWHPNVFEGTFVIFLLHVEYIKPYRKTLLNYLNISVSLFNPVYFNIIPMLQIEQTL